MAEMVAMTRSGSSENFDDCDSSRTRFKTSRAAEQPDGAFHSSRTGSAACARTKPGQTKPSSTSSARARRCGYVRERSACATDRDVVHVECEVGRRQPVGVVAHVPLAPARVVRDQPCLFEE